MKNGNIGDFGIPTENELELINRHTRRKFAADELYAFSVVLCDNDIDRDHERFTDEALEKLAELYIGKTGIFDHSPKAENQCARIFFAEVREIEGRKNRIGEQYKQLFARAYMPKSEAGEELILSIESGIKKEVSVGCSMAASRCSVCGQPLGACQHRKGRVYRKDGVKTMCYFELSEPTDAYEWSFVAVPAQPKAGVVKAFDKEKEISVLGVTKTLKNGVVTFSEEEATNLEKQFEQLRSVAAAAGEFLRSKKAFIVKQVMPSATDTAVDVFMKLLDRLEPEELFGLYAECEKQNEPIASQLAVKRSTADKSSKNSYFIV